MKHKIFLKACKSSNVFLITIPFYSQFRKGQIGVVYTEYRWIKA